jgi:hypothetical protein
MRLTLALACAGGLAAAEARADPVFDAFKTLCIDTNAVPASSLAAAEGMGWTPVPQSMLGSLKLGEEITQVDGRLTTTREGLKAIVVAHGKALGGLKLQADLCAVAAMPGDGESLKAAATKFAAVDPESSLKEPNGLGFIWEDGPGGRKRVTAEAIQSTPPDTAIRAMMIKGDASTAMIMLAVPTK